MKLATLKSGEAAALAPTRDPDRFGAFLLEDIGMPGSLDTLLDDPNMDWDRLAELLDEATPTRRVGVGDLHAPLTRPGKIVAVGLNYSDHADESELALPEHPLVFTKFPNSITGPTDDVLVPLDLTDQVDFEVELGVVIGKRATRVSKAHALEHVFGYTVLNDVSARDIQFSDGQWVRGKSFDTFCPMGPFIVTKHQISDPQALRITCSVNGQLLQDASTADMIFDVADLVSILSHSFTLQPGDVIATGTPSGVGFAREPAIFLRDGDVVECAVEQIGRIRNRVRGIETATVRASA